MNVYDFDETIFTGDSEDRFFEWQLSKKGFAHYLPTHRLLQKLYDKDKVSKTFCRQHQYRFLRKIHNLDELLEEYWDMAEKFMKPWYFEVKRDDDVIATGTPRFLMEPIMKRLGLKNLVATEMDSSTGRITCGKFAVKKHKLENFIRSGFDPNDIDLFYSDSFDDRFLADCAKKAYWCDPKTEEHIDWKEHFAKEGKR